MKATWMEQWIGPAARVLLVVLLGLFLNVPVLAAAQQPPEYEPVERMITKHIRTNHIPGMQVAITHGQEVDYLQVFGSAGEDRVMSVETPMFIASLSKPVTALAVMQLVEAGEIELDAPVRTYIPWFEVADPDVSGRITVRHLLYQTSGLSDLGYMPELPSDASIEDAVRALRRAEPTAEPGERFMYFNSNYTILGLIIETVSGQSYSDYMREHVFQPLGMGHTYTSLELAQSAGLAQGNLAVFGLPVPRREEFRNFDLPSGFILSTASDMSHFVIAQVNGGRYRDAQVLSPEGIALMHQPNPDTESPYAMGWWVAPEGTEPYQLQHGGDLDTYHADMVLLPNDQRGFVLLYNQNHLLYSLITFNTIRDGMISLLTGGKEPFTLSLTFFYRVLMVLFLVNLIFEVRAVARLSQWHFKVRDRQPGQIALDIAWNFALPLVLLVVIPALIAVGIGRGFTWEMAFTKLPVLITWLYFTIVMNMVRGFGKLWFLAAARLRSPYTALEKDHKNI